MPEYGASLELAISQSIKGGNLSTITGFWEQRVQIKFNIVILPFCSKQILSLNNLEVIEDFMSGEKQGLRNNLSRVPVNLFMAYF